MRVTILIVCLVCGSVQAAHGPLVADAVNSPGFQSEWWQLNASLADRDGRIWNLEWSLYRQYSGPRAAGGARRAGRMSLAHVAITTPDGEYFEQRFEHGGIVRAGGDSPRHIVDNAERNVGWEWVSRDEALFPARLSFSIGDRDVNLLLESFAASSAAERPAPLAIDHAVSDPLIRVRGFVDQGASKIYLRGRGSLDREWQTPLLAGNLANGD